MRTAIVYEGTQGSTAAVARIIAAEAAVHGPVIVGEVHEIPLAEIGRASCRERVSRCV